MADHSNKERIPGVPRYRKPEGLKIDGTEPFFPNFLLKEWIVGSIVLVGLMIWIMFNPVELADVANPADTSFIPVPDWYFLFLYQLLKYVPGQVIWLGTVVVPVLAVILLLLVPWIDRSKARHPFKRPIPTGAMLLSLIFMAWLTYEADMQHNAALAKNPPKPSAPAVKDTAIVAPNDPAAKIFSQSCATCHGAELKGQVGPSLMGVGNRLKLEQIEEIIAKGRGAMPPGAAKGDDAKKVAEWLAKQQQK